MRKVSVTHGEIDLVPVRIVCDGKKYKSNVYITYRAEFEVVGNNGPFIYLTLDDATVLLYRDTRPTKVRVRFKESENIELVHVVGDKLKIVGLQLVTDENMNVIKGVLEMSVPTPR